MGKPLVPHAETVVAEVLLFVMVGSVLASTSLIGDTEVLLRLLPQTLHAWVLDLSGLGLGLCLR